MVHEPVCSPNSVDGTKKSGKSRNIFIKLRNRSKSVVNLNREKSASPSYFSSWFSRKSKLSCSPQKQHDEEPHIRPCLNNHHVDSKSAPFKEVDRQFSASHSNLHSTESEGSFKREKNDSGMNGFCTDASTSKMPSYVNISVMANGYSRSRTNLNSVFSQSGDVHNLIIDDADVTDLANDFKSVVFVNDALKDEQPKMPAFSFIIPEFEVGTESIAVFKSLNISLEDLLTKCVEQSETTLENHDLSDDAREAILVASGHTRVLLKSKIKKMKQLIEKHKENTGEVTLNDLGSFWTMMDIEVGKLREQFDLVEKYRENNYQDIPKTQREPLPPLFVPRTLPLKPKNSAAVSKTGGSRPVPSTTPRSRPNVKDFLAARRRELAADSEKIENGCNGEGVLITTQ